MARCPSCRRKIDTTFYGACLDCGTLLDVSGAEASASQQPPPPAPAPPPDPVASPSPPPGPQVSQPASTGSSASGRFGFSLLARLVLAGLFIGGGALWSAITSADRDTGGEIVDAGTLQANELMVGDCLDWPGSGGDEVETFESVEALPCSEPHDLEVYSVLSYPSVPGTSYPGDDTLLDWGYSQCLDAFDGYIGRAYELVPDVDVSIFWPSEESWSAGDRTVHCLMVHIEDGMKLTGSLRSRDA